MTTRTTSLLLLAGILHASALQAQQRSIDLTEVSLEDLMKLEVTSVSKKEERLFRAPSAIYVLTAADIRRSGATSVPEALRLVPGLSVAQIDGSKWAVTARGFNNLRANKLLVLIDGRSIYTPMFSGIYWESLDVSLEDIERIEVIRGPGATMWGANAVNGVINIISRHARDTQGWELAAGGGSQELGSGSLRYGGRLGNQGYFRIGARYFDRAETISIGTGSGAGDQWNLLQGGFRTDVRLTAVDALMVSGSLSEGENGQRFTHLTGVRSKELSETPMRTHGRNLVAWWTHTPSPQSDTSLRVSYQEDRRNLVKSDEKYDVFDVDFQHRFGLGRRQDIVWGLGQRLMFDEVRNGFMVAFTPDHHQGYLTSAFVQNEVAVVPSHLNLTVGSKFEYHDVTGFNSQPNARISWAPVPQQNLWGAVSRAVRTPSRADLGLRVNYAAFEGPSGLPTLLGIVGNPEFGPERALAYEAGYRVAPVSRIQIDAATFYNRYDDLRHETTVSFVESDPAPTHLVVAQRFENRDRVATSGLETLARWTALPGWRIDAGHSWFRARFDDRDGGNPTKTNSPAHQWQLGSRLELPQGWQLDTTIFHVGRIPELGVPPYTRLDVRVRHMLTSGVNLTIAGQNLLDPSHLEFADSEGSTATEVPRSGYVKLTWRF